MQCQVPQRRHYSELLHLKKKFIQIAPKALPNAVPRNALFNKSLPGRRTCRQATSITGQNNGSVTISQSRSRVCDISIRMIFVRRFNIAR